MTVSIDTFHQMTFLLLNINYFTYKSSGNIIHYISAFFLLLNILSPLKKIYGKEEVVYRATRIRLIIHYNDVSMWVYDRTISPKGLKIDTQKWVWEQRHSC